MTGILLWQETHKAALYFSTNPWCGAPNFSDHCHHRLDWLPWNPFQTIARPEWLAISGFKHNTPTNVMSVGVCLCLYRGYFFSGDQTVRDRIVGRVRIRG